MNENYQFIRLCQPDKIDDPLTDVLRAGAQIAGAGDRDGGRRISCEKVRSDSAEMIPWNPTLAAGSTGYSFK
jgi:hypothetical protein